MEVGLFIILFLTSFAYSEEGELHLKKGKDYSLNYRHQENLAREEFEKAHKLAPDNPEVLFWLGRTYYLLDEYEKAKECLKKAVKISPTRYEYHSYLAYTYGRLEHEGFSLKEISYRILSIKHINEALRQNPKCAECYIAWGLGYQHLKMDKSAEECFRKAANINPSKIWAYNFLGALYLKKGEKDEAEKMFRRVVELAEKEIIGGAKNDAALRGIAIFYEEAGMYDEAIKYAKMALLWNPKDNQRLDKYSIKKLLSRIEEEKKTGKKMVVRIQDELNEAGFD